MASTEDGVLAITPGELAQIIMSWNEGQRRMLAQDLEDELYAVLKDDPPDSPEQRLQYIMAWCAVRQEVREARREHQLADDQLAILRKADEVFGE